MSETPSELEFKQNEADKYEYEMSLKKNIVIYHANCLDGTCAAWVASQYLKEEETEYIAVEYSKPFAQQLGIIHGMSAPKEWKEQTLYILDWCPEMNDLDQCCISFKRVILIDHHESAIKKLIEHYDIDPEWQGHVIGRDGKDLELFCALKNEWSGAMGTAIWFSSRPEYAFLKDTELGKITDHWLVKAVDDRDRWQFKYPDTKAINAALFLLGFDLNDWKKQAFTDTVGWILKGLGLLEQQEKNVQAIISSAAIKDDNAEKIIFCNCPYHLASEVGNVLAKDYRMAVLWYMDSEGQISVSLRSNSATKDWINCAKIAEQINGGGHANAAGFKWNKTFEEMAAAIDDTIINTEQNITF
jgi:nanoRNase/pAp phosphatase (c-di-AMP/oligoRNAs hydrolase)